MHGVENPHAGLLNPVLTPSTFSILVRHCTCVAARRVAQGSCSTRPIRKATLTIRPFRSRPGGVERRHRAGDDRFIRARRLAVRVPVSPPRLDVGGVAPRLPRCDPADNAVSGFCQCRAARQQAARINSR